MDSTYLLFCVLLLVAYFFGDKLLDLVLLWTLAKRSKQDDASGSSNLYLYVTETSHMDGCTVEEILNLCCDTMKLDKTSPNLIESLHDILLSYKYVSLYRKPSDCSLRGIVLFDEQERTHLGHDIVQLKLGLWQFRKDVTGSRLAHEFYLLRLVRYMYYLGKPVYMLAKLRHPNVQHRTSALSYLNTYPRHDVNTPDFEKSLLDEFGYTLENKKRKYNPRTCVLSETIGTPTANQTPVTEDNNIMENHHHSNCASTKSLGTECHWQVIVSKTTTSSIALAAVRHMLPRLVSNSKSGEQLIRQHDLEKTTDIP